MFAERIKNRLTYQRKAGLLRNPAPVTRREGKYIFSGGRRIVNFASNDYLGLGCCAELGRCAARNFRRYGTSSSSSRLAGGNYSVISRAEKEYAAFFGYSDALFFPSGYQANMGLISTLLERDDRVYFDKHIHASSVKGMIMSGSGLSGYNHNNLSHLERRLRSAGQHGRSAVLTESLFSMDGDILDAAELKRLKDLYGFLAIVDEAHAFGVLGEGGRGIAGGVADIAVGTFGKAFGLFGAFVLLPEGFKDFLFNFSSPLIYTTTLPEAHAATAVDALAIAERSDGKRRHLRAACLLMKDRLLREGFRISGDAHILALEIGDENKAAEMSRRLFERGVFVLAARYPTVALNRAILRIGITALHEEEDIDLFVKVVKEVHGEVE
ncbi:MAG: aminotransferase class I/II-fold pyridoxal phosphate-dependent enzyme [Syntrophales bacterium]